MANHPNRALKSPRSRRQVYGMTRISSLIFVGLLLPVSVMAGETVSGPATVVDGSTIAVGGSTFRLADTVAPGRGQVCDKDGSHWPCGQVAVEALQQLIAGRTVKCDALGQDLDGVAVAVCYAGDEELNRDMIASGMAIVHWQVGLDYAEIQSIAKAAHLGLWAARFDDPWEWRLKHTASAAAPHS